MLHMTSRVAIVALLLCAMIASGVAATDVPLANASFEGAVDEDGLPEGWHLYGSREGGNSVAVTEADGDARALVLSDVDEAAEIGVYQDFPLEGGQNISVRVSVRRVTDVPFSGAYIQLRFFPSNTFEQTALAAESTEAFSETVLFAAVAEGTTRGRVYLYTHDAPTPKVMVDRVSAQTGVQPPAYPEGPAPEPIPPQYDALKDLHLTTPLVERGEPAAVIVAAGGGNDERARAIRSAVADVTGVDLPIVDDGDPAAEMPPRTHMIIVGTRAGNRALAALYERFYALVDAKYPGPGGHVVRSVHNPFGNGRNVIVVGASTEADVAAAAGALIALLGDAGGAAGELAVGWLRDIELAEEYEVPRDPTEIQIWEASVTYGSSGYFGWNIVSKHMAAYCMTGEEYHAREFLRLAFPDEQAIREIEELDGERIENKHDPLAGPYHYSAHMMMLFWDLIEEDPIFTDEQRLRITNALSRQLSHRAGEGIYGRGGSAAHVGNRHGDWSAMSLFVLARYFQRDYPGPVWDAALASARMYFSGIESSAWLAGNNDHLFWYTSYYDPLVDYMHLSGYRGGMDNLRQALRTQDILFTGSENDWGLRASSLNFLHRAAELTGDGRFLFYRNRTGLDTDVFRLGQSWWPEEIEPREPTELVDTWTLQPMPEPMWEARASGLPLDQQFLWGTWRTTLDGSGDLMMIKGHNGGGRLPYHTFSVMEQRLAGRTLLKGYRNQVLTSADGMVEPTVAMDAALIDCGVLADTAWAVGEVPGMAFATWRRSVIQREGRYALFVDDLAFETDSDNMKVETEWQTVGGQWDAERNVLVIEGSGETRREGYLTFSALDADVRCGPGTAEELLSDLTSLDIVLLKAHEPGTWMEMDFTLDEPVTGQVFADLLGYTDRGILTIALDERVMVEDFDHVTSTAMRTEADLGLHTLDAGRHTLHVEVTGGHDDSERMFAGLVGLSIRPEGVEEAAAPRAFELHSSDAMDASGGGTLVMQWLGNAREGGHRRCFHLLAPVRGDEPVGCYRVDDHAAALALPEPAVAFTGEFEAATAEVGIIAPDHLFARQLRARDAALLTADAPLTVAWDFDAGTLHVLAEQPTRLGLTLKDVTGVTLDGAAPGTDSVEGGRLLVTVQPGSHVLEGAHPAPGLRAELREELGAYLAEARAGRERRLAAPAEPQAVEAPQMTPVMTAKIGGEPADVEVIALDGGDLLALAEGRTVHVLSADGSQVHTLEADGAIRVLRWWAEHELLLAGCEDEQVIAFDVASGAREWVFVSEMAQAVWEAGKQYWFKSAYPGIHGLHTGEFIGGETQAFVGSACTLEILDAEGGLIERMPVFWGNGWKFQLIDGPGDARRLLIARWPNGTDTLAVIDSERLSVGKSFYGVPEGHTMVGGWTAQNRTGIVYADVDAEGEREIVSATNGVWNRVTVFGADGSPRFNAQFGPGPSNAPYTTMRDMAVADLDGDGDAEIIVAIAEGLVVTLDHECRRVRARRLASPPTQVETVTPPEAARPTLMVGCEDGAIVRLSGEGEVLASGDAGGEVATMVTLATARGPMAVAATTAGTVSGFIID